MPKRSTVTKRELAQDVLQARRAFHRVSQQYARGEVTKAALVRAKNHWERLAALEVILFP